MHKPYQQRHPWLLAALFAALAAMANPVYASDSFKHIDSGVILGGALGGGAGAAVGSSLGGRDGAIIGGALGAAAGVAIASPQRPVVIHKRHAYTHHHVVHDHDDDRHHKHGKRHKHHRHDHD